MSGRKLKSGDVVRLNSGGPKMTVDRYVPNMVQDEDAGSSGLSMCGGGYKVDGESVRCTYFATLEDSFQFHPHTMQLIVHEDCLKKEEV